MMVCPSVRPFMISFLERLESCIKSYSYSGIADHLAQSSIFCHSSYTINGGFRRAKETQSADDDKDSRASMKRKNEEEEDGEELAVIAL